MHEMGITQGILSASFEAAEKAGAHLASPRFESAWAS